MDKCHCGASIVNDIEINTTSGPVRQKMCSYGHTLIVPVESYRTEVGTGDVTGPNLFPHAPDPGPYGVNNLDGGVCPECLSDDSEVEEHFIEDRSVDVHYVCNKCQTVWRDHHEFKNRTVIKKGV